MNMMKLVAKISSLWEKFAGQHYLNEFVSLSDMNTSLSWTSSVRLVKIISSGRAMSTRR